MVIGLKSGWVELTAYQSSWVMLASLIVVRLSDVFGKSAKGIEHVGSTSIVGIKAKPIIDIAIAVDDFDLIEPLIPALETAGFIYKPKGATPLHRYVVWHDETNDKRICQIHIVLTDSTEWYNYINFRDYLNAYPLAANEYEEIKVRLSVENPYDPGREKYLAGKHDFIVRTLVAAERWRRFK